MNSLFTQICNTKTAHSKHRGSVRASHPAALGSILGILTNISEELFFDVAEINWRYFLEQGKGWICWSNHLVLAGGKQVLQKSIGVLPKVKQAEKLQNIFINFLK